LPGKRHRPEQYARRTRRKRRPRLSQKTFRGIAAALIAASFLAGCTKSGGGTESTGGQHPWTQPGVLRIGESQDTNTLVPELATNTVPLDISMFIYSYAVRYDQNAKPVPDALSELPTVANGDVSKDGLTMKFKLRHDIKWQDGPPLTCTDLKFTWQMIMNPKSNVNTTDGFRDIKDIDCTDPYVALIHMKRLYAPYLQQLWGVNGNAPILPEHLLAKYNDNKGSINTAPYNSLPIEWQRGTVIRMEANPNYFLGAPKLREVELKTLPDENTLETQVQTHEIDLLAHGTGINWLRYKALGDDPKNGLKAIRVDSFQFAHIDFDVQHPIVSDVNVRRALAYATNRQEIIDKIIHGSGEAAETDQSPTLSWAYTKDIAQYPFDPAKARALLDADGWKVGPDGIRVKNGQRLEFNYGTQTESTNGKAIQTLIQRQWRDVGVQADVKNAPTSVFFQNGSTGILEGGHYDAAGFSWNAAADPDDSSIYSGDNLAPSGQNSLFWNNAVATAAEHAALGTVDQNARKKQYIIIQQQLALDVPTIVLYFNKEPYVYNTDLQNFLPSPVISPFWNPWEYSI
jgi:peptide/nickel transport system substrate-binding protein